MSKPEDRGRCINCGFLSKHPSGRNAGLVPTPAYYEIEMAERQIGHAWVYFYQSIGNRLETDTACFRSAANLSEEISTIWNDFMGAEIGRDGAAVRVFEKDRNCTFWYRYQPGLSPKEHYDQFTMEQLEQARREFEERLERDRKEFDLKLFEISQSIQNDSRKIASRSFWFNFFFTFVIIALTALQIWIALRSGFLEVGNPIGGLRRFFLPWM